MANVHRAYDIATDAYYVRVEGGKDLHKFSGLGSDKISYDKMRVLIREEQRKNPLSKIIDHAGHTS